MSRRRVFYSFHYENDALRVQQVRHIGVIEGSEPVVASEWESICRTGSQAIEEWIDSQMRYRPCVVVLVGEETASRRWVQYEIRKAWNDNKALLGIFIHNLCCPRRGRGGKGLNPFDHVISAGRKLSAVVPCYDPRAIAPYVMNRQGL